MVKWIGTLKKSVEIKYLTLIPTHESKEIMKRYEELWSKIRDLISSITKNWNDYDEKYMKTNFNLDNNLRLSKMLEMHSMIMVVRGVSHKNKKCYPQIFLNEYLHKS